MINCAKGVRVNFQDMEGRPWIFGVTGSNFKKVQNTIDNAEIDRQIVNAYVEEFNQSFKADKIVCLKELMMFIYESFYGSLEDVKDSEEIENVEDMNGSGPSTSHKDILKQVHKLLTERTDDLFDEEGFPTQETKELVSKIEVILKQGECKRCGCDISVQRPRAGMDR